MGRPVVGREDLQGTETSLGNGVSVATRRLLPVGGDGGRKPLAWVRMGNMASRGRSYESTAVMVGTGDISVELLQNVGRFQALPWNLLQR